MRTLSIILAIRLHLSLLAVLWDCVNEGRKLQMFNDMSIGKASFFYFSSLVYTFLTVDSLAPPSHSVTKANGGGDTVYRSFWSLLAIQVSPPVQDKQPAF